MNLTGSIFSRVGPAVTRIFIARDIFLLPSLYRLYQRCDRYPHVRMRDGLLSGLRTFHFTGPRSWRSDKLTPPGTGISGSTRRRTTTSIMGLTTGLTWTTTTTGKTPAVCRMIGLDHPAGHLRGPGAAGQVAVTLGTFRLCGESWVQPTETQWRSGTKCINSALTEQWSSASSSVPCRARFKVFVLTGE